MEIKVPEVGESVYEALVAKWHKENGELVRKDEAVCELETDKITLDLYAEADGLLKIGVPAGETVKIGTVIATITEQAAAPATAPAQTQVSAPPTEGAPRPPAPRKPAAGQGVDAGAVPETARSGPVAAEAEPQAAGREAQTLPPLRAAEPAPDRPQAEGRVTRLPMTPIRKRIAERLLAARQSTAMLTTFNEADMGRIVELRKKHKEHFLQKHGVALGLMSFFVKACIEALREYPAVNASIEGDDIVHHHFYDIGIAIGGEKGLVVPVLRDADRLHFHEIERQIAELAARVKENRLAIADLEGGTFTISNGGVYGSLLSTPILNPPQSGVLGMHAIQERPVARDGQVVIRPMMYLALSYDHRIIDGREAVQFLKKVKALVEEPEELFLDG